MSKTRAKPDASISDKAYSDAPNGPPPPFAFFAENPQATNALRVGANAMEHWVATGQELARFYSDRMKKDFSAMGSFSSCRTPAQFAEAWWSIASDTAHDYVDEFDKLAAINLNGTADE